MVQLSFYALLFSSEQIYRDGSFWLSLVNDGHLEMKSKETDEQLVRLQARSSLT